MLIQPHGGYNYYIVEISNCRSCTLLLVEWIFIFACSKQIYTFPSVNSSFIYFLVLKMDWIQQQVGGEKSEQDAFLRKGSLHRACRNGETRIVQQMLRFRPFVSVNDMFDRLTPLLISCEIGNESLVNILLEFQADVEICDGMGRTPLHVACSNGHHEIVQILVCSGASKERGDEKKWRPVHFSSSRGDCISTLFLLEQGVHIDIPNDEGWTPLHLAIFEGHADIVSLLLGRGASIEQMTNESRNKRDYMGWTALHICCTKGQCDIWPLLMQARGDKSVRSGHKIWTPLHAAVAAGHLDMVKILLTTNRNDLLSFDDEGLNPVHLACDRGQLDILMFLHKEGVDMEGLSLWRSAKSDCCSPLHISVRCGHKDLVLYLLKEADVDPDLISYCKKWTALHFACDRNDLDMVKLLLRFHVELDQPSIDGCSPIHLACKRGDLQIVEQLCLVGFNPILRNNKGSTPFDFACESGNLDLVMYLRSLCVTDVEHHNASKTALHFACACGRVLVAQHLIWYCRGDVDLVNSEGVTPVHAACAGGHLEIVEYFLREGFVTVRGSNAGSGLTLMHRACINGQLNIVTFLLFEGAEIDVEDSEGKTPIYWAGVKGHTDIVRYFLSVGFGLEEKCSDIIGFNILHCACESGQFEIAKLVIANGADIDQRDSKGWTCLHYSCQRGHEEMIKYLLTKGALMDQVDEENGWTPLHVACQNSCMDEGVIYLLCSSGANKKALDRVSVSHFPFASNESNYSRRCGYFRVDCTHYDIVAIGHRSRRRFDCFSPISDQ